ncbi:MAG: hypothetical protein A3H97_00635 [Acidobacteria bacterium RIFCSPLOWO2_02_FULL_65_29]|nr:MAG: hypothetical protein A3H97_00635 [Acidobacteria bacterium RIFCSPLOWO2_02_FULL_65_29]
MPTPDDQPPAALQAHAAESLRYIRATMERAAGFSAVPGWGGMLMGATAIGAAALAHPRRLTEQWLAIWLAEAALAASIGLFAIVRKARRSGMPLTGPAGRTFALAFVPALAAGAVLTRVLYRNGSVTDLPGSWLLLYGAAVTSGGALSVSVVPVLGVCLMALGAAALAAPASWGDAFMAGGFGVLHMAFGFVIARRHGG